MYIEFIIVSQILQLQIYEFFLKLKINVVNHYEPEWKFWLGFRLGGIFNITHIHNFCIPLDFLGIKEPKKNEKGQKKIFKGHSQGQSAIY